MTLAEITAKGFTYLIDYGKDLKVFGNGFDRWIMKQTGPDAYELIITYNAEHKK